MRITCPYCRSAARLTPNPVSAERMPQPRYALRCSGCAHTTVPLDPVGRPLLTETTGELPEAAERTGASPGIPVARP